MDFATAQGDYDVTVDPKLLQKLRKPSRGAASANGNDVFSLRYGFRPDSLGASSKLNLTRDKEDFIVEDTGPENHVFRGQATSSKDLDCVLVYDSKTKSFKLHPMDFTLRVNPSREKLKKNGNGGGLVLPSVGIQDTPSPGSPSLSSPLSRVGNTASSSTGAGNGGSPGPGTTTRVSPGANVTSNPTKPIESEPPVSISTPITTPSTAIIPEPQPTLELPYTSPPKRKPGRPSTGKKSVPTTKPKRVPRTASKSLPKKQEPVEIDMGLDDDDDDDDDLLGALANELEESLEDDSNSKEINMNNIESEESDEDDDQVNRITIIERNPQPTTNTNKLLSPLNKGSSAGPISLRGFVSGRRPEEDDLSSSEEE